MRNRTPSWALAAGLMALPAAAQIPPGFELIHVTNRAIDDRRPRINNRGQIVFDAYDGVDSQIMLYDNGELIEISDPQVPDSLSDLNEDCTIVWTSWIGPVGQYGPTGEIMMYSNGVVRRLTDNGAEDRSPRINNLGHVVWQRRVGSGACSPSAWDIFYFDGSQILRLTEDGETAGLSNQVAQLNEVGQVVWTKYDFCAVPWTSQIMLHSGGVTTRVSPIEQTTPQAASINSPGQVAWSFNNGVYLWETGNTSLFTSWGGSPMLNDRGDVAVSRWHNDTQSWEAWLYRNGLWYQLPDDARQSFSWDINEQAEVAITSGTLPSVDIRALLRRRHGDPMTRMPGLGPLKPVRLFRPYDEKVALQCTREKSRCKP